MVCMYLYAWKIPRQLFCNSFPHIKRIVRDLTAWNIHICISIKETFSWKSHDLVFPSSVPGQGLSTRFLLISVQTEIRWTSFPKAALLSAWWASWSLCCPPRSWTSVAGWDTTPSPPHWCLWVGSQWGACPPPWVPSCPGDASHHVSHDILRSQRVKTDQRNLRRWAEMPFSHTPVLSDRVRALLELNQEPVLNNSERYQSENVNVFFV